jgi:hypothetical protein
MLTKLQIKNFRCFRELEIAPLRRVNLITGQNNTGKTALLEALSLLLAQPNPGAQGNLPNTFRAGVGTADLQENFWSWLFPRKNPELAMELKCELSNGESIGWLIQKRKPEAHRFHSGELVDAGQFAGASCFGMAPKYRNTGIKAVHFSTRPSDPNQDALDFNRVVVKRRKKELVSLLQPLEGRLEGLEALQLGRQGDPQAGPLIYAEIQGLPEMIPVTQLGQGFSRLLEIYSEILATDAQVLLVDEIENGIHHSVLPIVWKGLFHAAKEADLQIFATTHSWECILAADQAARENGSYDLSLIRLDRVEGDVKATVMDEKTLATAKELHWELR